MGHNARPRGTLIWQAHKTEILTIKHASVESKFGHRAGDTSESEGHVAFVLSAPHLGIDHVIIHRVETEQFGGHRAVERERRTIAGGRAERIAVGHAIGGFEKQHIVGQAFGVGAKPKTEAGGHGHLQMGIAWHEHVLIAFALLLKFREEVAHRLSHLANFVAREKLEVNEHLVVARASAMYFLPHARLRCLPQ